MIQPESLTPADIERIRLATAALAAADEMDLATAGPASLVGMIVQLRGSLADTLQFLPDPNAIQGN
ncbi:hypothetical protein ACGFZP_13410 [Kitasatospora sp. NPDC048239]|uniref:hypothetical protein n=1 Tax=Kitasatospora sp. NPDC048239 TaxID=3364046 RepID=UPI00371216F8